MTDQNLDKAIELRAEIVALRSLIQENCALVPQLSLYGNDKASNLQPRVEASKEHSLTASEWPELYTCINDRIKFLQQQFQAL